MVCKNTARHMADMQLNRWTAFHQSMRCIGHGVTAATSIAQQKVNILTSVVLHHFSCGQLQFDQHDIG